MKEINKKSAMETENTTAQYKNPNTLYHENEKKETGKMILIKDGMNLDIFDDKNMSDRVLMLDYPEGTNMEQLHKFYELIGKECEIVEAVHPKRLYTLTEEKYPVLMLVDEEYLYHKTAQVNLIASYLYETDIHGHPINGNVLIIGMKEGLDGMEFCGMNTEHAKELRERLITMTTFVIRRSR